MVGRVQWTDRDRHTAHREIMQIRSCRWLSNARPIGGEPSSASVNFDTPLHQVSALWDATFARSPALSICVTAPVLCWKGALVHCDPLYDLLNGPLIPVRQRTRKTSCEFPRAGNGPGDKGGWERR